MFKKKELKYNPEEILYTTVNELTNEDEEYNKKLENYNIRCTFRKDIIGSVETTKEGMKYFVNLFDTSEKYPYFENVSSAQKYFLENKTNEKELFTMNAIPIKYLGLEELVTLEEIKIAAINSAHYFEFKDEDKEKENNAFSKKRLVRK